MSVDNVSVKNMSVEKVSVKKMSGCHISALPPSFNHSDKNVSFLKMQNAN